MKYIREKHINKKETEWTKKGMHNFIVSLIEIKKRTCLDLGC